MKFTSAVSILLCAEAALAARFTEKRRETRQARQQAKRNDLTRQSKPMMKSDFAGEATNNSFVEYSSNWAGAVLIGTGYTSVTGVVVVPTLSSSSSKTETAGSAVRTLSLFSTRDGITIYEHNLN
jgi:hypothetical protein